MSKTYHIKSGDPGGQIMDMSQNYSLLPDNSDSPGKTKNNRSTQICLNYSLSTSLLSILMTDVKNISNWSDTECKDRI